MTETNFSTEENHVGLNFFLDNNAGMFLVFMFPEIVHPALYNYIVSCYPNQELLRTIYTFRLSVAEVENLRATIDLMGWYVP